MDGMLSEFDDKPALPIWLGGAAALAMLVHLYLVFVWVPTEATMGIVQRLFYFHVPAATVQFTACFVGGIRGHSVPGEARQSLRRPIAGGQ